MGVLCLAVAVLLNAVLRHQVGFSGDEPYYSRIAAHPGGPHNFPYAFRVGLPYLVHLLPFAQSFSWEALALLCAGAAGGACSPSCASSISATSSRSASPSA